MFYVYRNSAGRKALLTITHVSRADRRAYPALRSSALYDRATRAIGDLRSVHGLASLTLRGKREKGERGRWRRRRAWN